MLSKPLLIAGFLACLLVLGILAVGIGGFAKGGDFNRKHANKIMRLRLAAQFLAVILIVGMVYFFGDAR